MADNILDKKIKSTAKAIGVKAILNIDDKTRVVTSFGKGNDAVLEHKIVKDNIADDYHGKLNLQVKKPKYEFKSNRKNSKGVVGYSDNSDDYEGLDRLRLKGVLENMIFGEEFQDNIRVQIAYAVFDIVKVLAIHSNNITYIINRLHRENNVDIVGGVLNYKYSYKNFVGDNKAKFDNFYKNANDNFVYYDSILTYKGEGKIKKSVEINKAFDIFNVFSFLRNNVSHFANFQNNEFNIFCDSFKGLGKDSQVKKTIDNFFKKKIETVNNNFFKNEKANFNIAVNALNLENDIENQKILANTLYKLSVEKSTVKMLGYSLKKLRESAIKQKIITFGKHSEQEISTVRSKLYKLFDLVVLYYFEVNKGLKGIMNGIVDELRLARSDKEKDEIYDKYAKFLFKYRKKKSSLPNIKRTVNSVIYFTFRFTENRKNLKKFKLEKNYIQEIKSANSYKDFTKLILYICNFLDGKEINELITKLINRFQVIDSFNKTVESLGDNVKPHKYGEKFNLFENSGQVVQELLIIKSIARMEQDFSNVKMSVMYKDAMRALGVKESEIDDYYNKYFSRDASNRISSYIANNVINSSRFQYIIKYISPACVYQIASNKSIVKFVLNEIPKAQLDKYYKSVLGKNPADKNTEVEDFCKCITGISFVKNFGNFRNIHKDNKPSKEQILEREKGKALLKLYFTVVYLVVKNLVKTNALYSIAFFYVERDSRLYSKKLGENELDDSAAKPFKNFNHYYDILTILFMYDKTLKHRDKDVKKLSRYIVFEDGADVQEVTKTFPYGADKKRNHNDLYRIYRNVVMHLNAVSTMDKYLDDVKKVNSYFELYHYFVQRAVIDGLSADMDNKKNKENKEYRFLQDSYEYAKNLLENNTSDKLYSQTLLRSMNIPFGYTLPRYKNLSYEKLFDRQRLEDKQRQEEREKLSERKR